MFRLNPIVRGGLCASAMSLALPVVAAESGDTLVVTASATEQNLKDAPASISVITQEDLKRKPVQKPEGCVTGCAGRAAHQRRG